MVNSDSYTNLIKLCVGSDSVEDLLHWRDSRQEAARQANIPYIHQHITRMWPRRRDEFLNGGSLYWVFKGFVLARQKVLALEERIGADGIRRCGIVFDPELIRTVATPRRPFQGWRYLAPEDSPADLPRTRVSDSEMPQEMERALADIGLR